MGKKLSAEERMHILCEKSLPLVSKMLDGAGAPPWRNFATLQIPENDRVNGLLEVGIQRERWYVLAGVIPAGTDRLVSQYLKQGTKEEVRAYMEGPDSPREMEVALRDLIRQVEKGHDE